MDKKTLSIQKISPIVYYIFLEENIIVTFGSNLGLIG